MPDPHLQPIAVTRSEGVVTVTIDRPHRKNAADTATWRALGATFAEVAASTEDRVLVLTGTGDSFCSGADLGDPEATQGHSLAYMRFIGGVCLALHRLPQPTIAKVNGLAAGAGLNMALACDLVVASSEARFCEIFARRGLSVDFGGTWLLPRLVGLQKAKELALLADFVDAADAERIGLVNRVLAPGDLDAFVDDWAARLAAGPPIALALTKRMLNDAHSRTLEDALEDEGRSQSVNLGTADTVEAIRAFLQKRTPKFEGR